MATSNYSIHVYAYSEKPNIQPLSGSSHSCCHLYMPAAFHTTKGNLNSIYPPILITFATGDSDASLAGTASYLTYCKKQVRARTLLGHITFALPDVELQGIKRFNYTSKIYLREHPTKQFSVRLLAVLGLSIQEIFYSD